VKLLGYLKKEVTTNIYRFTDPSNPERFALSPKVVKNRYEITDLLSSTSGFGLVFIAKDTKLLNKKVLVKAINYKKAFNKNSLDAKEKILLRRKNLKLESQILLKLNTLNVPCLPLFIDYIEGYSPSIQWPDGNVGVGSPAFDDLAMNEPYFILQYIKGQTLSEKAEKQDKSALSWQIEVLKIAQRVLNILDVFHGGDEKVESYIYQDLKPENIICSPNGTYTLIDFGGVALNMHDKSTTYNKGIGTPGYMAPEIADPSIKKIDKTADIYSLGVLIWSLLMKEELIKYVDENGIIKNFSLNTIEDYVFEPVCQIIKKAVQPDPKARYKNASQMYGKITSALQKLNSINYVFKEDVIA
jgi:serine/threonine protein kinase